MLLNKCGLTIDDMKVQRDNSSDSDLFSIFRNGVKIAEFGQYSKETLLFLRYKERGVFANLSVAHLYDIYLSKFVKYIPVSKFPNISRDLSLLIDKKYFLCRYKT